MRIQLPKAGTNFMRNGLSIITTGFAMLLCGGCVSHTKCIVYTGKSGSQLEVYQATRGLIPGIGGFTTHADSGCTFYLQGRKDTYAGSEVVSKGINSVPARYSGSICFFPAKERVAINLTQDGRPFEFNGTYHYHSEHNDALSP